MNNGNTITVPDTYVRSVSEMLETQRLYFEASAKAKKTKLGSDYQEAKDLLRQAKEIEARVRKHTNEILGNHFGKMTAEEALAKLREQTEEDLELVRKGVRNDA